MYDDSDTLPLWPSSQMLIALYNCREKIPENPNRKTF